MSISTISSGKKLSLFTLIMINVIAVDSLRTLTAGAVYGFSLLFFYLLAVIVFFIPSILITAELATSYPQTGGVYIWVREAFGKRWGFLAIWLQWVYNIVWYPTIFAFIAATLAYLINPHLADNKIYTLVVILTLFWGSTWISCLGVRAASWTSIVGAIVGTILPMVFIMVLGANWLMSGKPIAIDMSMKSFFPSLTNMDNLAFLTTILFGLMGMEMSAVHAGDVNDPRRNYPRALLISGLIIVSTLAFASLAIAIVIPSKQISLVAGLIDAFGIFFRAHNMAWFIPVIAGLIVLGSLSGAAAWILGPTRGLLMASQDIRLPKFLEKTNQQGMPVGILLTQAIIFTILSSVFIFMPTVNSGYWFLSDLTSQLALLFYLLMFAAVVGLRYKKAGLANAYRIPGKTLGMWLVVVIGMTACIGTIIIGFLPPSQVSVGNVSIYEILLVGGIVIFCLPAWFLKPKV